MTTHKFKVGELVRDCVSDEIGVVREVSVKNPYPYRVDFGGRKRCLRLESELLPLEETTTATPDQIHLVRYAHRQSLIWLLVCILMLMAGIGIGLAAGYNLGLAAGVVEEPEPLGLRESIQDIKTRFPSDSTGVVK